MVRSQDKLTFVASENGFADQRRSNCQRDYKRAAGFIPADCRHPSLRYSLSAASHYSLKRIATPPHQKNIFICTQIHKVAAVAPLVTQVQGNAGDECGAAIVPDRVPHWPYSLRLGWRWKFPPKRNALRHWRNSQQKLEAQQRRGIELFNNQSSPALSGRRSAFCFPFS